MELRELEGFVAVAEHLHFGRAAGALSIGQPAVSQQVAKLERELGVDLLDRSGRTVRLTPAGSRFLPRARAVLASVEQARASVLDLQDEDRPGALRVGSCAGLGDRMDRLLQLLRDLAPTTSVELVSASSRARLERVAAGQLDAAFVRGSVRFPDLDVVEVWQDQLLVVLPAAHSLAASGIVDLADLAELPLRIVPRRLNPPLVDLVISACADAGFTPVLAAHWDSLENMIGTITTGPPSWTVVYESHARTLRHSGVAFLPTRPQLLMATSLAVRRDERSRAVAQLLRACDALDHD